MTDSAISSRRSGVTRGSIHWRDLQLENGYSAVTAQLQAGRANDLLGVEYAKVNGDKIPYVLYHPGFTKSGDMSQMPKVIGGAIRAFAAIAAKPVIEAIEPIDGLIDCPPSVPLTAIDRGRPVRLDLPTLNLADAQRLTVVTEELVSTLRTQTAHIAPGPQKLVHDSPSNSDA